ncbi:nudix domain-containing protein [Fusarium heterosporum]|uniref:Nudix domain-containing protein n=1 Tax=Fusarium heterosporum TaxID=42747 RepID=A0A8H5X2W6_FUSHE|nr:nudix domain-containing protein [Fusarium heterosporum]
MTFHYIFDPSVKDFDTSKHSYLTARPQAPFGYIATSALVLDTADPNAPRILLLQRASSDDDPNKWEPPGGAVDDQDESILNAAARELREEAGLQADWIGGPVGEPHFFTLDDGKKVCQFNFLVRVTKNDGVRLNVKLDPDEHQCFVWASEAEVRAGKVGDIDLDFTRDEVERTVLQAFEQIGGDQLDEGRK